MGQKTMTFLTDRGYDVEWVDDGEKAFNRLDTRFFDVVVTELNIDRVDGIRLMAVARERNPDICVVFTTSKPDIELATEAMRQGAYDFQIKPLNMDKLEVVIQRGLAYQQLVLEQIALKRRLDERFGLASLVGRSRQMVHVYSAVREIGPTNETVLIYGEPGTDKDLIAQAIHNSSPRRNEAFVILNCASMPDAVVESELFGDGEVPRAGTAPAAKGRIELADQGTIYLNDIHTLTAPLQHRLLHTLLHREINRGEGQQPIPIDVRLIAATSQRLDGLVESGVFDGKLLKTLSAMTIEAPTLRERRDDIPLLVNRVLRETAEQQDRPEKEITRNAMNLLLAYEWPGNVRELRNVVAGMALTARGDAPLGVHDVPDYLQRSTAPEVGEMRIPTGSTMREVERIVIEQTMKVSGYNKEKCAQTLKIGLRTLYRKLKDYDIH
jgi:DNA-binding NtrC family response regulator